MNQIELDNFDSPTAFIETLARDVCVKLGFEGFDVKAMPSKEGTANADFQLNGAMSFAGRNKMNPFSCAEAFSKELTSSLSGYGTCFVTKPGFINIKFDDEALLKFAMAPSKGVWPDLSGTRVVIDYSSPNCAKRMHVGHLRSTVIGDALRGILLASKVEVVPVNHLGDFGTPFGIIISQARFENIDLASQNLDSIEEIYKRGAARFKSDESFAIEARTVTSRIQSGLEPDVTDWRVLLASSMDAMRSVYSDLGIGLSDEHIKGESSYQSVIQSVLNELMSKGVVSESEGAICYFPDSGKAPLLLAKSDASGSGYLYGATDAAALKQRSEAGFNRMVYVVDSRQSEHFEALFEMGRKAGWIGEGQEPIHVKFGMLLDSDGKPFKTRSGDAFLLKDLISLAVDGAWEINAPRLSASTREDAEPFVRSLAVGALKYSDLSRPKEGNIKFDASAFCSLTGNTSAYIQYVGARAASIENKAQNLSFMETDFALDPAERALLLSLAKIKDACRSAAVSLSPHLATDALYSMAQCFSTFYEHCPVVVDDGASKFVSSRRLALCSAVASVVSDIFKPLGISAPKAMPRATVKNAI